MAVRTMGVEEEFLLVSEETGLLLPVSRHVVERAHAADDRDKGEIDPVEPELFRPQIETATRPCTTLDDLRQELLKGRRLVSEGARSAGAALVAVPSPVLADEDQPTTPTPRYQRIIDEFGQIGRRNIVCGMHVHVGVDSDDEGVGIIDRVRPWLPVLLALSANSPYYWGEDTGYASWRSQMWNRWPSAGPAEIFGDAKSYRREIDALIATGAAFDQGMVYLVARLAAEYPTVEIRVADICTEPDDAVLIAALVRAVADTAAAQWASGAAPPAWRTELIGASTWRAARFGLTGRLVHPETRALVPVREAVAALIDFAADSLDETGDRPIVDELFERLLSRGSGAARQRAAYEAGGSLDAVVHDLIARTEASYASE